MTAVDLSPAELATVQRFGMLHPVELRNEPVQKRSQARLEQLLAAARVAYAKYGRDRFTTQQVAEEAGASIGTVYRYFPDRVLLMDAIAPDRDRQAHLVRERVREALTAKALGPATLDAIAAELGVTS
jgi:hypothetical protein